MYVGLLLRLPLPSLTTNDVSVISRMCLSFITSTVTGNDDCPTFELEPANPYDVTIGMADLNNDVTYEGWGKTSTACHIENVSLTWPHPVLQYFGYLSCDGPCSNL